MKLFLMPKEPTWWIWLMIASLLALGLAGVEAGRYGVVLLGAAQALWFLLKYRAWKPYPVQIRIAFTLFVLGCMIPALRWMLWVPMFGTLAFLLFGYCLMGRMLSLMPWNCEEPVTGELLRRTFLSAPVISRPEHGLPPGCDSPGICELEANFAKQVRPHREYTGVR
jgi:hypothetical protein